MFTQLSIGPTRTFFPTAQSLHIGLFLSLSLSSSTKAKKGGPYCCNLSPRICLLFSLPLQQQPSIQFSNKKLFSFSLQLFSPKTCFCGSVTFEPNGSLSIGKQVLSLTVYLTVKNSLACILPHTSWFFLRSYANGMAGIFLYKYPSTLCCGVREKEMTCLSRDSSLCLKSCTVTWDLLKDALPTELPHWD